MHKLYELKEKLCKELESYAEQSITGASIKDIDTLAHAAKNVCKIIEDCEKEEYSEAYSRRGYARAGSRSYRDGGSYRGSYEGSMENRWDDPMAHDSYEGGSYARGRGARRDSMGRYSRDHKMIADLRELQSKATDESTKQLYEHLISMAESM